jgi:hypothetical protein
MYMPCANSRRMELDSEAGEGQLEVIKLNVGGTRYEVLSTRF